MPTTLVPRYRDPAAPDPERYGNEELYLEALAAFFAVERQRRQWHPVRMAVPRAEHRHPHLWDLAGVLLWTWFLVASVAISIWTVPLAVLYVALLIGYARQPVTP